MTLGGQRILAQRHFRQPRSPHTFQCYVKRLFDPSVGKLFLGHGVLLLIFHGTGRRF
jgi:hypothetical protein